MMFLAPEGFGHHFAAVPELLRAAGEDVAMETLQPHAPLRLTDAMARGASLVVHAEGVAARAEGVRRAAARACVPLALVMDGVLEYANTFLNTAAGPRFLRPAPGDVVLCAGGHDRRILEALGNTAVGCGLPRLDAFVRRLRGTLPSEEPRGVLIATANTPAFTFAGRRRVVESLGKLRVAMERRGVPARWRVAADLAAELGVERDTGPLHESLMATRAVVTTASTLALEAMLAGRPTAIVHPHPWPLWLPTAWIHRGDTFHGFEDDAERMKALAGADEAANRAAADSIEAVRRGVRPQESVSAGELVDALLAPDAGLLALQARAVAAAVRSDAGRRMARICRVLAGGGAAVVTGRRAETIAAPSKKIGVVRVVNCVEAHASSVGGVSAWSERMERAFAARPELGIEWRTLFVGPDLPPATERLAGRAQASACVVDPTDAIALQAEAVADAIRELDADVIVPNYGDLSFAGAQHERARSRGRRRVIAVAHTNDGVYRAMLASNDGWDAAVGVSEACSAWLQPLAAGRPVATIACGVPCPAVVRSADDAMLRLAYVGRVVERQKRVSDLLVLLKELDRLEVAYEFDVIGDGDALGEWQRRLALQGSRGVVRVHGPRELAWVQRFWERADVNVIVSEAEGTSVAMLESMAAGVIPCITAVDDSATAIVRDGENGIAVGVGEMAVMAARLAELARDSARRARFAAAARRTIREKDLTIEACCGAWAGVIRESMAGPAHEPVVSDAAVRARAFVPLQGELKESDARRLLRDAGFTTRDGEKRPGNASVIAAEAQHPGAEVIAKERLQGRAVAVLPTQCESPGWPVASSFAELAKKHRRIAIWAARSMPRSVVEWLAARPTCFAGFVHPQADALSTLLGARCVPLSAAGGCGIDAFLVPDAENNPQGIVVGERLRGGGVRVEYLPSACEVVGRAREAAALFETMRGRGLRVVTSCDSGTFAGATALDLRGDRPDLVLLRGEEIDFDHFAAMRKWRREGTVVRSIRFADAELSSPERYAELVRSFGSEEPFAIYGGGRHTENLLRCARVDRVPVCIIDDHVGEKRTIAGAAVLTPAGAESALPRIVILSSFRHEETMWNRTAAWRERGVRVLRLYAEAGVATAERSRS